MAFLDNIPDWVKAIPQDLLETVNIPGLYGLSLYCRVGVTATGALAGFLGAGLGDPANLAGASVFVGKLSCDIMEDKVVRDGMCYEFNKRVCPMGKFNIKKVRHPSIGVEPMQAKKCPPCPEKGKSFIEGPSPPDEPIIQRDVDGYPIPIDQPGKTYNGKLVIGEGQINTVTEQNAVACSVFSYSDGVLINAESCLPDLHAASDSASSATAQTLPVFKTVVPEFAMPDTCPASGPLASLQEAAANAGQGPQEGMTPTQGFVDTFCEVSKSEIPVPVFCLPKMSLQSMIAVAKFCH